MKGTQFKILVIDDNPMIYDDFKKILVLDEGTVSAKKDIDLLTAQLFGAPAGKEQVTSHSIDFPAFIIDYANQGEAGVKKVQEAVDKKDNYVLAFVDIKMPPGIDGVETIKRIWAIDKDIQVVICTAFSDYSWEETVMNLGTKDNLLIIKKPYDTVSIRQMACALSKKWNLLKEQQQQQGVLESTVKQRTESLEKSLSITRATLDSSAEGIIVLSEDEVIRDINNNFFQLFNIDKKTDPMTKNDLFSALKDKVEVQSQQVLSDIFYDSKNCMKKHLEINLINGRILDCYINPYTFKNQVSGVIVNIRDLTDRIAIERQLKYHATHDSLTELHNRSTLVSDLNQTISAVKEGESFFVLFLDLDSFKSINDNLGHDVGDAVLRNVAKILNENCAPTDHIARLGGDEFVIVKKNCDQRAVTEFCDNLIIAINNKQDRMLESKIPSSKVSIGIAQYPQNGDNPTDLLRNSDLAMYSAKKNGGNQHKFYTAHHANLAKELFEKEIVIEHAFNNGDFVLHYQPEINVQTGEIIAMETLIRWKKEDKDLLNAAEFIHFAEQSNLIIDIGVWVLHQACKQNKEWQDQGLPKIKIAINVAHLQLQHDGFIDSVKSALAKSKLEPQYLGIELSENIFIDNDRTVQIIDELKSLGVAISFDDFGTGNTGLNNLVKIPINQIKIDKLFVQNMKTNKADEVIVKAIIQMAKELEIEVIAEGIETQEQADSLISYGCQKMQGYYFGKAMSPADVVDYMTSYKDVLKNNAEKKRQAGS